MRRSPLPRRGFDKQGVQRRHVPGEVKVIHQRRRCGEVSKLDHVLNLRRIRDGRRGLEVYVTLGLLLLLLPPPFEMVS